MLDHHSRRTMNLNLSVKSSRGRLNKYFDRYFSITCVLHKTVDCQPTLQNESSSSSMDTKFHCGGESDRIFRHIWLTLCVFVLIALTPSIIFSRVPSFVVQRAWVRACMPLDSSVLARRVWPWNRMISSGRQPRRRIDTSHRQRDAKDRWGMEIDGPGRRSATENSGPGATARHQSRRWCGHPGDVMLRARRYLCGVPQKTLSKRWKELWIVEIFYRRLTFKFPSFRDIFINIPVSLPT